MKKSPKNWELYERFVARLAANQASTDLCVTLNARIKGKITGRKRQVDVVIDCRHDTDNSRRIIIDAKMRNRKIDTVQVEAFKGLMEEVRASHGYLVCPAGYTKAAERRAQRAITVCLLPLKHLQHFDPTNWNWDKCLNMRCSSGQVFWDGYPEFTVTLQPTGKLGTRLLAPYVHYVGKCDRCRRFHVRCLTCNELFSMTDKDEHQCACKPLWFWLSSIERDKGGQRSAELHTVFLTGNYVTVDRKPV